MPFVSDPSSSMAASYRALRYKIQSLDNARALAVTSPGPREGKTTCALNLAMAFAEHGAENVLLVEANWQRPSIAAGLGFKPELCFARQVDAALAKFASAVAGNYEYCWHATAAYFMNLHVLAVDVSTTEPSLLGGAAFQSAMASLSEAPYERIIVDCPPVFESADMNIIEDCVDGVLFAARVGKTRGKRLRQAKQQLEPVQLLGTVAAKY